MSDVMLVNANALRVPLASGSVQMVVTSPPYYGLRDYSTATWTGGDPACDHLESATGGNARQGANKGNNDEHGKPYKTACKRCGAVRVDNQIGLEESPEAYIAKMVEVFRECWRVLRDDGTLWLNIGDSYAGSGGAGGDYAEGGLKDGQPGFEGTRRQMAGGKVSNVRVNGKEVATSRRAVAGVKPKDLIGIPWALAFALRADGWYLRSEIIWHKPNAMPESATDRPTKAHEQLFLLSKSAHYYYDQDAIREAYSTDNRADADTPISGFRYDAQGIEGKTRSEFYKGGGRNKRSVWTIATSPYAGSHFATYPPALVEPCIKAGTSERGACPVCGAPWERILEPDAARASQLGKGYHDHSHDREQGMMQEHKMPQPKGGYVTLGWQPGCEHDAAPVPCVVFDPFAGSGTTLQVARALGRHAIGLDLSMKYLQECARPRLALDALDAWRDGIPTAKTAELSDLPLFGGTL